jgi:hypothetical protein
LTGTTISISWSTRTSLPTALTARCAFTTPAAVSATTVSALAFARGKRGLRGCLLLYLARFAAFTGKYIALINPHLDADYTKGCMCFCQPVVNIRTQGMQGYLPLYLFLGAGNFRSTQASTNNDLDALGV